MNMSSCTEKTNSYALLLLQVLGFNYLKEGQLERTRQIAQLMLQAETGGRLEINTSLAAAFGGMAEYQRDHLEEAARYFTRVIDSRYTAHITGYREAVAGMAIIHQIRGESAQAWDLAELISRFDLEQSGTEDIRTSSLRARLLLMQGDLEKAGSWADTLTDVPPDMALLWMEEPQVTRAHILVARGRDTDLQSALQILDSLEDIANRTHNTRHKIEVLALRALALKAQGKSSEALAALKQSVDLSRPGEFIRVFVDLGNPMQELLRRLMGQDHDGEAIRRILVHFPGEDQILDASETPAHRLSVSNQALVEPLTVRELEVLRLLCGPASVKEMAEQLHLSPATVKRHTINIYAKLGVNKRWKAVARAEELDLLPAG